MSRLTELLRQARKADEQLGKDLEAEIAALTKRRTFGLVFEQHQPEAVELPGRSVRRGDKVRVLPPRGEVKQGGQRLWRVDRIERVGGTRMAHLSELEAEQPEEQAVLVDDVVVVAEFRDRIYPGLVETGRVERGGDKPFHTVINAENYHALEMLTYTHRGKVDAIYIDPPYNTGAKDWRYNNNYVESDDDYRHSKWLAFMERRLEVAKELLNPDDSVLIVTIDEKEYLRLGMLLEQTFPEARIQMVSSVINPGSSGRKNEFSRTDEYIYFVMQGSYKLSGEDRAGTKDSGVYWRAFQRANLASVRGRVGKGACGPSQFYPIFVERETGIIAGCGNPIPPDVNIETVPGIDGCDTVWPIRPDGTHMNWCLTPEPFRERLRAGYVKTGNRQEGKPQSWPIYYLSEGIIRGIQSGSVHVAGRGQKGEVLATNEAASLRMPTTNWNRESHNARTGGTEILVPLLSRRFPYPKSLYAVEDALRFFVKDKPEATILDFFSGSGTTAHAVMRLNKQDGGRRQCISVTNNEVSAEEQKALRKQGLRPGDPEWEALGICDYITKPRVTAAITGRTPQGEPIKGDYKFTDEFPMSDGFEENAAFFTLTYEAPLSVRHNRAFERIAPMLWMRAGSRGRVINDLGGDGWDVAEAYGVLENIDQMGDFVARVAEVETVATVFVVTDSDAAFQMTCRDLPERVTAVRLYESYLHNFMINRRAGA